MSKRKGVSADEKRSRMLELFYEKKEFFQLKELEKIAPKEKGIVAQSVKDVVQGLVDDSLVDSEKVGTSIYFWAFPSKTNNEKKHRLETLEASLTERRSRLQSAQERLLTQQADREDGEERIEAVRRLGQLQETRAALQEELKSYGHADPQVLQACLEHTEETKQAADRWTDNIFALRCWCKKKMSAEESSFNKQFGVPADFDYLP